ncbi:MAG: FtsX-like permease family protein [Anaerolineae bacterium]
MSQLFKGDNEIVISDNMAQTQNIHVGDMVRVSGTEEEFVVRGIVPTSTEAGLRNPFASFFGFAYFDEALKSKLPVGKEPNTISLVLNNPSLEEIEQVGLELGDLLQNSGFYRVHTVPQLLKENQQIADLLSSFIVVLGLGALLIGGVSIMNTMLVMMRRRTEEIASLKTFGLKGRQIALMFLAEAALLGIGGSLLGGVIGSILSAGANAYGQTLIQQPLVWRIYPEAILFGLILGMAITLVFGIIPVLIAVKVRPAIILRPNEAAAPNLGWLQSLGMIVLVVLTLGVISGQILRPAFELAPENFVLNSTVIGIVGVAVTLLILGILIGLLWIIVWIIGKLPAFGFIDLRLALRNLTTHRTRTATTLLALAAGMFALSSIAFFGAGVSQTIRIALSEGLGGNVLVFAVLPPAISNPIIDNLLDSQEGVSYRTRFYAYSGNVRTVNGTEIKSEPGTQQNNPFAGQRNNSTTLSLQIGAQETTNPNPSSGNVIAGRGLTSADQGHTVAVVQALPNLTAAGLSVGSTISVNINGRTYDFEVVGLTAYKGSSGLGISGMTDSEMQIPVGVVSGGNNSFAINVAQVEPDKLNEVLLALSSIPLVYAIDVTFIDGLISRFINQMSAIPILVGLLSLGAAAVIMANTVALSTLERRRQIGILKAVGLKGGRIFSVMLLENTVVSLLGSLLGIGLSSLGVAVISAFGLNLTQLVPPDATPVAILLLVTAVAIACVATFLSARAAVGERVTNVLRYE